jgi:hypothetical protein
MEHVSRRSLLIGGGVVLGGALATNEVRRMGSMDAYAARAADLRASLADPVAHRDLVRFATLAASGHNAQPWRFRLSPDRIVISPDGSRRTPAVDPDDHHLFVSLGCAVENLVLAAGSRGLHAVPVLGGDDHLAVDLTRAPREASPLVDAIRHRQSTRADFDGRPLANAEVRALVFAARIPGVDLVLLTEPSAMERVLELVVLGNDVQMADGPFVLELSSWIRFNPRAAMEAGDGLFSATTGNPNIPSWLGRSLFRRLYRPKAEEEKYVKQVRSSAGVAVFFGAKESHASWVEVGRSCQRFALQATALGIRCSFLNQPVEVAALRAALASLAGAPGRRPDLVMRFGHGASVPPSLRRPVDAVIES